MTETTIERARAKNVSERIDYTYGRYRIVCGLVKNEYHAYAYTGSRVIHRVTGEDQQKVSDELKAFLNDHMESLKSKRGEDGVPTAEEYREAIEALRDKPLKKKMRVLKKQAQNRDILTMKNLIRDAGLDTLEEADSAYARIGRAISIYLDFNPSDENLPHKLKTINVIALPKGEKGGLWEWGLRPQILEALEEAKL